jgi:hypothetical protein
VVVVGLEERALGLTVDLLRGTERLAIYLLRRTVGLSIDMARRSEGLAIGLATVVGRVWVADSGLELTSVAHAVWLRGCNVRAICASTKRRSLRRRVIVVWLVRNLAVRSSSGGGGRLRSELATSLGALLLITLLQLLNKAPTARGATEVWNERYDDIPELALYECVAVFELRGSVSELAMCWSLLKTYSSLNNVVGIMITKKLFHLGRSNQELLDQDMAGMIVSNTKTLEPSSQHTKWRVLIVHVLPSR